MDAGKLEEALAGAGVKADKENEATADKSEGMETAEVDAGATAAAAAKESPVAAEDTVEKVEFKVIFNKKKHDISFALDENIGALKAHLQPIIDIPPAMMKVMIKGLAKDEMTLRKLGVSKGSKVMVVGSSLNDVLSVSKAPTEKQLRETEKAEVSAQKDEAKNKMHKKILDKGKPDDAMVGFVSKYPEPLPPTPLSGMVNKHGGKVRLTFKLDQDQVWIGTKERTEKISLGSIKNVVSEPIEGHPEYHILALQLGPTEASRYWIYWVPAQYIDGIKESILGKWQMF